MDHVNNTGNTSNENLLFIDPLHHSWEFLTNLILKMYILV